MALEKQKTAPAAPLEEFRVKEGYAFFHLSNVGLILKSSPAGSIVKLENRNVFEQSWKLEPVKKAVENSQTLTPEDKGGSADGKGQSQPATKGDNLDLLVGFKGNAKLGDLFHDMKVTTYEQVLQVPDEKILECFKGNKVDREAQLNKFKDSALALFGKGNA